MNAVDRTDQIRQQIIKMSYQSRSAHLGSALSCVEILDAILTIADITPENNNKSDRDKMIVSKGHAAMAVYSALATHGLLEPGLLDNYLENGSALWGHVTKSDQVPAIDVSSGSLGHGLSLGAGYAYGNKLRSKNRRIFCLLSDGECDEGSVWEASAFVGHHGLKNLTAVIDYNKIQSFDFCSNIINKEPFLDRWAAFGWDAVECDGHNSDALMDLLQAEREDRPRVIIAHTIKGRGIPRIENTVASHYKPALGSDVKEGASK